MGFNFEEVIGLLKFEKLEISYWKYKLIFHDKAGQISQQISFWQELS